MKKIIDNLLVGTIEDIPYAESLNYSILGACKDPLHRQHARLQGASEDGYLTKSMPKGEPEYLFAERDHALYLNLIDPKEMKYIPDEVINKALCFIDKETKKYARKVLIVCNKAESRSPSIALMWLIKEGTFDYVNDFDYDGIGIDFIFNYFKKNIYNNYRPSEGMRDYVKKFWEDYCNGK